jgi:D-sedoheptulose 7-phosphate isomerase
MIKKTIRDYIVELQGVLSKIPLEEIERIVECIYLAFEEERSIFVFGNGGSAATASHFACDLNKGACHNLTKRVKVHCLNDNVPSMLAYANDASYDDVFVEQLKNFLKEDDVIIAISSSGNSKNIIKAIRYAREYGALTIGLAGGDGGLLCKNVHHCVVVPSTDIQKIEDVHLVFTHIMMKIMCEKFRNNQVVSAGLRKENKEPLKISKQ